ncbi:nicotinate-nucleotide--dimethylbenzimidazole phosphoribosyltransferase [Anaerovibrio sp.]|uniref:nicotinate-nucleotide--dimethylbenzimidazole phosphoribosyltransferase n=1 Tax=Anaerovibrio sp. TaxID=1872532 RepID=UPI003F15E6B8
MATKGGQHKTVNAEKAVKTHKITISMEEAMEKIRQLSHEQIIQALCRSIEPSKKKDAEAFGNVVDKWLPQEHGIGSLKDIAMRYVAVVGMPLKTIRTPFTAIFCADHGVAAENVSAYPPETTLHMATNYVISKGAAANAFSNFTRSGMTVVDMGINGDTSQLPIDSTMKIACGTQNSAQGPAMTREQAAASIMAGIAVAAEAAKGDFSILLPGEMGIANTTASAAITAVMCGLPAEEATGRGTNISDQRLQAKIATVKKILDVNQPDASDPLDVLAKVGGFELGAIAGLILGGACNSMVTILDGFNTGAAALIATALCPNLKDYLIASHIGGEQGHRHVLNKLGLAPVMKLDLKLGEAIGSSLVADLLIKTLIATANLTKSDDEKMAFMDKMNWNSIPVESVTLTDKTFDYYTNTMPELDKKAMEDCQTRLDNLAKPIYSLGVVEKIATQLSGILGEELPHTDTGRALLLFGLDKVNHREAKSGAEKRLPDSIKKLVNAGVELTPKMLFDCPDYMSNPAEWEGYDEKNQAYTFEQAALINGFAQMSGTSLQASHLFLGHTQMDAFEYGRLQGEKLALKNGILGIGMIDGRPENIEAIAKALIAEDGSLRYEATSFLNNLTENQQLLASAVLGAMISAAHNHTMIVLDNEATVAVARYAVNMLPELEPFLLPIQPNLYQMNIKASGITALAGISLVTASLHMLNDMKTFSEAQVAVANDGPGKGRQVN